MPRTGKTYGPSRFYGRKFSGWHPAVSKDRIATFHKVSSSFALLDAAIAAHRDQAEQFGRQSSCRRLFLPIFGAEAVTLIKIPSRVVTGLAFRVTRSSPASRRTCAESFRTFPAFISDIWRP